MFGNVCKVSISETKNVPSVQAHGLDLEHVGPYISSELHCVPPTLKTYGEDVGYTGRFIEEQIISSRSPPILSENGPKAKWLAPSPEAAVIVVPLIPSLASSTSILRSSSSLENIHA